MKVSRLSDMTRGWFVGDFSPTLYATRDVEVAVRHYQAGEAEQAHYHKVATEITVVVQGRVRMNDRMLNEGDVVLLEPGEVTDFAALTDAVTTVVKLPGAPHDKYVV